MPTCFKCNGSGEIPILGNFALECECQKVTPAPKKEAEQLRPQPTRALFPPGEAVRFKVDYKGWRCNTGFAKGGVFTVQRSGDCDPYPFPYVAIWVDSGGERIIRIVHSPRKYLELELVKP